MSEESGQAPSWECHWDPEEPAGDGCGAVVSVPSVGPELPKGSAGHAGGAGTGRWPHELSHGWEWGSLTGPML